MANIVLTHTFAGFINNFTHLLTECLPVVHHYLHSKGLLSSPEQVQFYCDTKLVDVLSLYSSHPVRKVSERPPDAAVLSEQSRYLGIVPLPSSWYGPTKSGRKTRHYKDARFFRQQAIQRFKIPGTEPSILVIQRLGVRKLHSDGLIKRLQKIAPVKEVVFEALSFQEQVVLASQSRCIIGTHGAGLSHMFFMREGGVIEICPARYVIDYFQKQAALAGLHYALIEGTNPLQTDETNLRDRDTRKKLRDVPVIHADPDVITKEAERIFAH